MLNSLLTAIPQGNKRHPVVYNRMLDTLLDRVIVARNKFLVASLPRTLGTEFLEWMLLNFNLVEADSYENDITLYTSYIEAFQDKYRTIFDPSWMKQLQRGKFVRGAGGSYRPTEIYLNCGIANPTKLPFEESWDSWKSIRAIEILYHDSTELPIDMFTGYVSFNKIQPTFVVVAINIPLLLMKWYKYNQEVEQPNELEFLKTEEYDQFLYDTLDIWTTNMILATLTHTDATAEQICSGLYVPGYVTGNNIVVNGIDAFKDQIELVRSRNVRLQDFIDTSWHADGRTVRQRVAALTDDYVLPEMRQYLWLNILKVLPYLKMLTLIIDLDPENPVFNRLIRSAYNMYVRHIKFANLPNYQYTAELKAYVSAMCQEFDKIFVRKINAPMEVTTSV